MCYGGETLAKITDRTVEGDRGPSGAAYSRWKRCSEKGIFARTMDGLAAEHGEEKTVMIDATYLKAHRTASSMAAKKGGLTAGFTARQAESEQRAA